jgi:hypothetical protein
VPVDLVERKTKNLALLSNPRGIRGKRTQQIGLGSYPLFERRFGKSDLRKRTRRGRLGIRASKLVESLGVAVLTPKRDSVVDCRIGGRIVCARRAREERRQHC